MNTNRETFENHPKPSTARQESPFSIAEEPASAVPAAASPFTAVARQESPFMIVDDAKLGEAEKSAKLPERRKVDSSFQAAEPSEGFCFDAIPQACEPPPIKSPIAATDAAATAPAFPFAGHSASVASVASAPTQAAIAAFAHWQEPAPPARQAVPSPFISAAAPEIVMQTPSIPEPIPEVVAPEVVAPEVVAPEVVAPDHPVKELAPAMDDSYSDSFSIRQLELRAIFGVDREMDPVEIMERALSLPGILNLVRVNPQDMSTIEALKSLIPTLGFGSGRLKLYSGSIPLDFIREGAVTLAVQSDGDFAPGVRETLMIVARELNRLS